jgi:hypothetical protein
VKHFPNNNVAVEVIIEAINMVDKEVVASIKIAVNVIIELKIRSVLLCVF